MIVQREPFLFCCKNLYTEVCKGGVRQDQTNFLQILLFWKVMLEGVKMFLHFMKKVF